MSLQCEKATAEEIARMANALTNTSSGLIILWREFDDGKKTWKDTWKSNFKDVVQEWIPENLYEDLLVFPYNTTEKQNCIFLLVKKSRNLVTFSYNAYKRGDSYVRPFTDENSVKEMIANNNEGYPEEPNLIPEEPPYSYDTEVKLGESTTREFKHFPDIEEFSADAIEKKLRKKTKGKGLLNNVSAFANTEGGKLFIGVQEKNRTYKVKGYPEAKEAKEQLDEEEKLKEKINTMLKNCFWNGKKLDKAEDRYWEVSYLAVKPKNGDKKDRKVIQISVSKVPGGMFVYAPVYHTVGKSRDGRATLILHHDFDKWISIFCPETKNKKVCLEKYINDDIELSDFEVDDCCVEAISKELQSLKGEEEKTVAFINATQKRPENYVKFRDHIRDNQYKGIASVIKAEENLMHVLVIDKDTFPTVICCFENGADRANRSKAFEFGLELHTFLMSSVNAEHLPLHFYLEVQMLTLLPNGEVDPCNLLDKHELVPYDRLAAASHGQVAYNLLAKNLMQDYSEETCIMLMKHLRAKQARRILEKKEKIVVVVGKSGTKKIEVALAMIKEATETNPRAQKRILVICASDNIQGCEDLLKMCTMWKINEDSLSDDQKSDLKKYDLVVVRAFHALVLAERWDEGGSDFYKQLLTTVNSSAKVIIFVDSDQKFKTLEDLMQDEFHTKVVNLAKNTLPTSAVDSDQLQRIKNSPSDHTKNDKQLDFSNVRCDHQKEVGHVTCFFMKTSVKENNGCVSDILDKLRKVYEKDSIVILYSELEDQLRSDLQSWIKNGEQFPIRDTAMCPLEEYYGGGVEADVILFLFPPKWGLDHLDNEKYIQCGKIAYSQDVLQLFLLPCEKIQTDELEKELKDFLLLMNPVSTDPLISFCIRRCMY